LGKVTTETFVRFSPTGLRLDLEVEAQVRSAASPACQAGG
jgi:hypothetical protein